jgi:hypothetical protein
VCPVPQQLISRRRDTSHKAPMHAHVHIGCSTFRTTTTHPRRWEARSPANPAPALRRPDVGRATPLGAHRALLVARSTPRGGPARSQASRRPRTEQQTAAERPRPRSLGHMPRTERPAMSEYGVPADTGDALPWGWAKERLIGNHNYWLVTASADGRPASMPVWGVWLDSDRFWCSCSPNARKARNIAQNPHCVVTTDDTVECVSVEGLARIAADPNSGVAAERTDAVDLAVAAYVHKYWPDETEHEDAERFIRSHAIVEVTPTRAFGIIERHEEFASRATRWVW